MKKYHFTGQLELSDSKLDQSRINYIIINNETKEQSSLSDILDNIFNSQNSINKLVRIIGRTNNAEFNGMGNLLMCHDKSHVEGYCIGSLQLDYKLFNLIGEYIEVYLEDYTDFSFSEVKIRNEDAKSIVS